MLKKDKFGIEEFRELNSSDIWNEKMELIYEPLTFIKSKRDDSFNPDSKSSHRILVPESDSCSLSSILPKKNDRNLKILIVADEGFGKTSTLKFVFLQYKKQLEFSLDFPNKVLENEDIFTNENKKLVPIFIDLEKLTNEHDWNERENFIEQIAKFLKIDFSLFTELDNDMYIFLFDNIDKVSDEKFLNLINKLTKLEYNSIVSTKRKLHHAGHINDDEWSMYEILPLNRSQILNLMKKIIEHNNNGIEDKDKIEISNSKRFAAFLPFVLLPAEAKKPHFISVYTEQIIKYIKSESIPEILFKSSKLTPDEIYKFLDQIDITNNSTFDSNTSSTFYSIRKAKDIASNFIGQLNDSGNINLVTLCKKTNSFSSTFFFQKLFVKEFIKDLLLKNDLKSDKSLDLFINKIIEYIKGYRPLGHPYDTDSSAQMCFEYLAIIVRYLKNFYHKKYHDTQIKIFNEMKKLYLDNQRHYFIRSNALWLMRLSYDIDDKNLKAYGEEFLSSVKVPAKNAKLENFDIFYLELLFIVKCCLNNENIKKVSTLIKKFSEFCPFSGLIFYIYLIYKENNFTSEIEPLLTAIDTEPKSFEISRFSSRYSLVVRAIQAIGALGNIDDIDIFIDHGFLDIYSTREFKEDDYSSIERFSFYAIEELFYHKLEPRFDALFVNPYLGNLKEPIQNRIPYLFDDINRHICIYSSVCKNIDKTIRKTERALDKISDVNDIKTNLKTYDYYLLEKSVMILTEISKQYFRDKSYRSQRGELIVSFYQLNEELRKIHEQPGMQIIEEDNDKPTLHFEVHTVKIMQEIVKSYTKEVPKDLIELSKVSFTNWLDNYQLEESDKPSFSKYINNSPAKLVSNHVVKSNTDIIERVISKQLSTFEPNKKELVILDIGAGVGNTSEAIIEQYFSDKNLKKKVIYAVELLPEYVKLYCRRMGKKAAERYCFSGCNAESINYEVHVINEDIYKVLEKFCNEGKLCFKSADSWISKDVIPSVFQGQSSSAILSYLIKNSKQENEVFLRDLEEYNKLNHNDIYNKWFEWMEKSLNTYSGLTDSKDNYITDSKDNYDIVFRFKPFDLVIANYSLHHLTSSYRKKVYKALLKCSSPGAFFAISDPNGGLSDKNRGYFNFTDEGVFACFMSRDECINEVQKVSILENKSKEGKRYKWVNIPPENDDDEKTNNGFIAIFQKKIVEKGDDIEKGLSPNIEKPFNIVEKDICLRELSKPIKVGLVQLDYGLIESENTFAYCIKDDQIESQRVKIENAIIKSLSENVNIICFPELSMHESFIPSILNKLKNKDVIVIGGSYYKDGYNICPIIYKNEVIFKYKKISPSPFEMHTNSGHGMKCGHEVIVVKSHFGNFIVLTCCDFTNLHDQIIHECNNKTKINFIINPCYDESKENLKNSYSTAVYILNTFQIDTIFINNFFEEHNVFFSGVVGKIHYGIKKDEKNVKTNMDNLIGTFNGEALIIGDFYYNNQIIVGDTRQHPPFTNIKRYLFDLYKKSWIELKALDT